MSRTKDGRLKYGMHLPTLETERGNYITRRKDPIKQIRMQARLSIRLKNENDIIKIS